jgi:2-ketocyclohexanecarboxyl-CoA hydrolase
MDSYEDLLYDVALGVGRITINRPAVMNAMRDVTFAEFRDALLTAQSDPEVGVIVVTGVGERAFCAGGDVKWERDRANQRARDGQQGGQTSERDNIYATIRTVTKPVVARINGYAVGGGFHITYVCDFAIAADHAIFGHNGVRVGAITQGWMVTDLARMVGLRRAKELFMLARRYSATQLLEWGMLNAVVPMADLDAAVDGLCEELLGLSPTALRVLKMSFEEEYEPFRREQERHDLLREINAEYWSSGEQQEGASAFLEKRRPDFSRWL